MPCREGRHYIVAFCRRHRHSVVSKRRIGSVCAAEETGSGFLAPTTIRYLGGSGCSGIGALHDSSCFLMYAYAVAEVDEQIWGTTWRVTNEILDHRVSVQTAPSIPSWYRYTEDGQGVICLR